VASGLGITIVPRSVADVGAARQPLRVIDIQPPITQRYTALAWKTSPSQRPAPKAFLTTARAWLSRLPHATTDTPRIRRDNR
jgi:DNA-binding transcriptional LysR family regulator